jgi:hypothetical protein
MRAWFVPPALPIEKTREFFSGLTAQLGKVRESRGRLPGCCARRTRRSGMGRRTKVRRCTLKRAPRY